MKKNVKITLLILLSVAVALGFALICWNIGSEPEATAITGQEPNVQGTISIPGYESITLKSNEEMQSIALYNPARNTCFFIVSLLLDDEVLFTTAPIAPGAEITEVALVRQLDAGSYDTARLRYSCYSLDDLRELNGADIALRLEVEP